MWAGADEEVVVVVVGAEVVVVGLVIGFGIEARIGEEMPCWD